MDRREMLLSIGFSEEHLAFLDQVDQGDAYINVSVPNDYQIRQTDVSNVIVDESKTDFFTKVVLRPA